MTKMNWDAVRMQRNAGPRTGSGGRGLIERIPTPVSRVTPTGRRHKLAGGTVEYGLSARWPDDICPVITAHFRWPRGPWVPVAAAVSAADECFDAPGFAAEGAERLAPEEWLAQRRWRPRRVPPRHEIPGFEWWIEQRGGYFVFEGTAGKGRRSASVPVHVIQYVEADAATPQDLMDYARASRHARDCDFRSARSGSSSATTQTRWKDDDRRADEAPPPTDEESQGRGPIVGNPTLSPPEPPGRDYCGTSTDELGAASLADTPDDDSPRDRPGRQSDTDVGPSHPSNASGERGERPNGVEAPNAADHGRGDHRDSGGAASHQSPAMSLRSTEQTAQLKALAELRSAGVVTDDEFAGLKERILAAA